MENEHLVRSIEGLYPADSEYSETKKIGRELLIEAICQNWRSLDMGILQTYENLCLQKERE